MKMCQNISFNNISVQFKTYSSVKQLCRGAVVVIRLYYNHVNTLYVTILVKR
jgi:hypothetical protein